MSALPHNLFFGKDDDVLDYIISENNHTDLFMNQHRHLSEQIYQNIESMIDENRVSYRQQLHNKSKYKYFYKYER